MSTGGGPRHASPAVLAAVAALAGGVADAARAGPAEPMLLDCATILKGADEAALVKRFGRAAVRSVDLDGAEGQTERGTAIHPEDPSRRLNLFWWDTAHRRRPASIIIRDRSQWRVSLPGGTTLGLGAGVAEVEAANGRPFAVNGFFWDQGGFSTGWKGGALARLPGGCSLSVRFNPDPKVSGKAADRVSGETTFASSDAALRAVAPTVSVLSLDRAE